MSTFCPHSSAFTKIGVAKETVPGSYTEVGFEAYAHLGGNFTRGHTPIDGSSHIGSVQTVAQDGAIGGILDPGLTWLLPFRYENMQRVLEMILGGANPGGGPAEWGLPNALSSWSIGISDGAVYRKFAGCNVDTAQLSGRINEASTISAAARSVLLVDDPDHTNFPAVTPDMGTRPFILTDTALKVEATVPVGLDPVVPFNGYTLDINNRLIVARANQRRPRCFRRGTLGITGTLDFEWSEDLSTTLGVLEALAESTYDLAYVELIWTEVGSANFIKFVMPVKLDFTNWTVPRASGPISSPLNFRAFADDASFTNPMLKATSTVY